MSIRATHDLPFPRDPMMMHVGGDPSSRRWLTRSSSNTPISMLLHASISVFCVFFFWGGSFNPVKASIYFF
jgi:hypothetical protein